MNERKILLITAGSLSLLGLLVLPQVLKRPPAASEALSIPGETTAGPGQAVSNPLDNPAEAVSDMMEASQPQEAAPGQLPPQHPQLDDAASLATLAEGYLKQGDPKSAVNYFTRSLEKKKDPSVMVSLAMAFRHLGQTEQALQTLNESLALDPNSMEAHYVLGLLEQYDLADYEAAITAFEVILPKMSGQPADELKNNVEYLKQVRDNILKKHGSAAPAPTAPQEPAQAAPAPTAPVEYTQATPAPAAPAEPTQAAPAPAAPAEPTQAAPAPAEPTQAAPAPAEPTQAPPAEPTQAAPAASPAPGNP